MTSYRYALIVAGGKGLRMGNETPKQFLIVKGKPVLMHTIEKFRNNNCIIILVLPENQHEYWLSLCKQYNFTIPHQVAFGGSERFHSVKNGLDFIHEDGLVAIHDGVRPCISAEVINKSFEDAEIHSNAIVAIKPKDSIRMKQNEGSVSVNRDDYFLVQTPQTFPIKAIKEAYLQNYSSHFTDDASVFESAGNKIHLTEGDYRNIKITTPDDLELANLFL